jgi:hypothetical protein
MAITPHTPSDTTNVTKLRRISQFTVPPVTDDTTRAPSAWLSSVRPDELERLIRARLDALGPAPRAELLHVLASS